LEMKQVFDIGDKLDALKETMESLAQDNGDNYNFYGSGSQNIHNGLGKFIVAGGGSHCQYTQTFS
jgi:hypothetical protein